jgi:hypothetical protein
MRKVLFGLSVFGICLASPAVAQNLTIEEVLQLHSLGIGDEAIVAKIESEETVFELSTAQMIQLREQGLSSAVIAALLKTQQKKKPFVSLDSPDPMVEHPAGVYVLKGEGESAKMERMNFTVTSQAKTGGVIGYALTAGIASASVKVAIQDETAPMTTGQMPKFYFFFDDLTDDGGNNTWASGANTFVNSPSEFTLIELAQKEGRREARVGSMNIAGAKSGVMDKDRIPFDMKEVRSGVFEVSPSSPLPPGEYGFIFSLGAGGTSGAMTARIFDFAVR